MPAQEQPKFFLPEHTEKPDGIETPGNLHGAIANLVRSAVENGMVHSFGILFWRKSIIMSHLGHYNRDNFEGVVNIPLKNVDIEEIPRPLWDHLKPLLELGPAIVTAETSGAFRGTSQIYLTSTHKQDPSTTILIIAESIRKVSGVVFEGDRILHQIDPKTIDELAKQTIDLSLDQLEKSKVSDHT